MSIVTPVHNAQEHLAECVESVVRQTYKNWEYVIVDNCSSDRTPEIASSLASVDSRIRYQRHEEFVDVIESYNRAFRAIDPRSTYCKVVGADDWLYPECVEKMVELGRGNEAVGVVGAYRLDGDQVNLVGLPDWKTVVSGREVLRQSLLGGPYVTGSPTSLLYRTALLRERQPFFDPSFRHADTEAAYWSFTRWDFGLVHQVLTFTRHSSAGQTPFSTSANTYAPENIRMLIRYGPDALSEKEYRPRLRHELRRYMRWLLKQRVRHVCHPDAFYRYHQRAMNLILSEADEDKMIHSALAATRILLGRGK